MQRQCYYCYMNDGARDYSHLRERPETHDRMFTSDAVERKIEEIAERIADPDLERMFRQCLPSTLDTMVSYREDERGNPDTVVLTGDIPAMWLRDSTNQVWPYLRYADREEKLQKMFAGLVFRQTQCVLIDPYANAFRNPHLKNPPRSLMWGPGHQWHNGVWERKYELDSLAAFMRLSNGYFDATGDTAPFNDSWKEAVESVITVIKTEQEEISHDKARKMYRAQRPSGLPMPKFYNGGKGPANRSNGLSRNLYRPSDDEVVLPYLVPANAMASVALTGLTKILHHVSEPLLAHESRELANKLHRAVQEHGTINHPEHGHMYAYEVDGYGNHLLMDDPNVPSLMSLPYLGYGAADDYIYQNTRDFILSDSHEYFVRGKYEGQGSPHTPDGNFWPIATIMRALTSDDDDEIIGCLKTLKETHAGTYFMHESINVNNPLKFTRPWFGWANSLFGELILDLSERKPWILASEL
jgi:meiotically up-regulated gene 157 (Mug157) protein